MERLIQLLIENMDIDELAWYLEEKAGKEEVVRCLRALIYVHAEELKEDYSWLE